MQLGFIKKKYSKLEVGKKTVTWISGGNEADAERDPRGSERDKRSAAWMALFVLAENLARNHSAHWKSLRTLSTQSCEF